MVIRWTDYLARVLFHDRPIVLMLSEHDTGQIGIWGSHADLMRIAQAKYQLYLRKSGGWTHCRSVHRKPH